MKSINHDAMDAALDGALSRTKLKIASNWKMFKELISGIYSDKAYAITRETFANGIDSHVAAGCPDRPIRVHVPSAFEPHYSVRDYGTSMSRELMEKVYCTLGESTKDDPNSDESNRYVGKFGLGSKSPFAYTDSFQVTAYQDGKAFMYDVFKGSEGPEMALLAEVESDEERGILVSFGVDPKDIADFKRAIQRAAEGLDVTPIFEGDITLHVRQIKDEGNGWRLQDRTQSGKAEARQGTVLYPLNFEAVIDCPDDLKPLFDQPFRFDFPIGSLDIVTSREALSYDEETSANIIARLKEVQADIMKRVNDAIVDSETYWKFCQNFKSVMETYPENRFGKLLVEPPTFKGRPPKTYIEVKTNGVRYNQVVDKATNQVIKPAEFKFRFGNLTYSKINGADWGNSITFREDRDKRSNLLSLDITRKLIVVTEDMRAKNRYPAVRIRKLLDKLIAEGDYRNSTLLWIRHQGDSQYVFNRMFAAFGRPEMTVYNLLDIDHVVPQRQYASGPRMPFKVLTDKGEWRTPDVDTPLPGEAYFVPMRNGDVDFSEGRQFSGPFMADILPTLVAFGADDKPIIGIPASSRKIVTNNPQWTPFYAFVSSVVEDMYDADAHFRWKRARTHISKHSIIDAIENIKRHAEDDTLVRDAFTGSSIEDIMGIYDFDTSTLEDDGRQGTILDIIARLEDFRVSQATIANSKKRNEYDAVIVDNPSLDLSFDEWVKDNGGLESTTNLAHTRRQEIADKVEAWNDAATERCQVVANEFPLLGAVRFYYNTNEQMLAREVLNYVFNKRLVAVEQSQIAVDTAKAA